MYTIYKKLNKLIFNDFPFNLLTKKNFYLKELEKSFAVSTPGDSSPVCYPPCSPPPAPAAYLSSVRASSRKLDGASGHPSPDRDSVGRLLR